MTALLPLEDAQALLLSLHPALEQEENNISDCYGRYLAESLMAMRDQPAGAMSAMDGYAVRARDGNGPWQIVGNCIAGSPPCRALERDEAARIFTGALLPENADTVIIQENVVVNGEHLTHSAAQDLQQGQNIRKQASDFAANDMLLPKGSQMTAAAIGLASIAGYGELKVGRKVRVALISTGSELVAPGKPTSLHQIPNSNAPMLAALLAPLPVEIVMNSIITDDLETLQNAIAAAAHTADIIVTIGGASVGDHDLVRPALNALGAKTAFWRIALKPGKPLLAGTLGDAVILGLPGNPASAFVTAQLFLLPMVRHLAGAAQPLPEYRSATCLTALPANGARAEFLRAEVSERGITPFPRQDSGMLTALSAANALLFRPTNGGAVAAGDAVQYLHI